MTDIYKAAQMALEANGCERIKDFYAVGPVQRAAVESFAEALRAALEASHHKPAPPELVAEVDAALGLRPKAEQQEPVKATPYNLKRIAWELERTAVGDGFYGNALRVVKDIPGITPKDRSVLDRYSTGTQTGTDHVHLQWLAQWLYNKEERAPEAPQPKAEPLTEEQITQLMADALKPGQGHSLLSWARRIERAHGIGGNA